MSWVWSQNNWGTIWTPSALTSSLSVNHERQRLSEQLTFHDDICNNIKHSQLLIPGPWEGLNKQTHTHTQKPKVHPEHLADVQQTIIIIKLGEKVIYSLYPSLPVSLFIWILFWNTLLRINCVWFALIYPRHPPSNYNK